MAVKPARVLVCEGPDDVAALRVMIEHEGFKVSTESSSKYAGRISFESGAVKLKVISATGKSRLAETALLEAPGTASERPDRIGVCFDPDDDQATRQFDFFVKAFNEAAAKRRTSSPLGWSADRYTFRLDNREIALRTAPWRIGDSVSFDGLAEYHDLERVLVDGVLDGPPDPLLLDWARDATSSLVKLVPGAHGWKRAFRIWNAALEPKSESFVERLLQNDHFKLPCLTALRATPVAEVIRWLIE